MKGTRELRQGKRIVHEEERKTEKAHWDVRELIGFDHVRIVVENAERIDW